MPETFSLHFPSSIICIVTMHVGDGPVFLLIITSATPQPLNPLAHEGKEAWMTGLWARG